MKRLLIRPGAIGDIIVSLPALEYLSDDGFTEIWLSAPCVPLIGFADKVRSISSTGLDLLELGLETPVLAALQQFDSIVSWYGANRAEFRDAVRGLPFAFHNALPTAPGLHAVDYYLSQAGAPLGAIPFIEPGLVVPHGSIVVHPFSGSPAKNWSLEKFLQLRPCEFAAFGDSTRFEALDDLARWLAGARVFVGNDSGISHLAAAVGVPTVAIFRTTDPAVWSPRGRAAVRILTGDPTVEEVRQCLSEASTEKHDAQLAEVARY